MILKDLVYFRCFEGHTTSMIVGVEHLRDDNMWTEANDDLRMRRIRIVLPNASSSMSSTLEGHAGPIVMRNLANAPISRAK